LADRNTIVAIDLLTVGAILAALGYVGAQSIPITALGFAVLIIGALILLIVPDSVPQDAYRALLRDSITNIEIVLEESGMRERAYFQMLNEGGVVQNEIRAFIPFPLMKASTGDAESVASGALSISEVLFQKTLSTLPRRFIVSFGPSKALCLVPPGNEIVKAARIQEGDDLEESIRTALVGATDLARSVLVIEEGDEIKVQISGPKLSSDSPFFNGCLGTPLSCIASCVAATVRNTPIRIIDEKIDRSLIRLTLQTTVNQSKLSEMKSTRTQDSNS
jgi:hypothetical protein